MWGRTEGVRTCPSVNILCVTGATLGLAAITLVWYYDPPSMPSPYSPYNYPTLTWWMQNGSLTATLFIAGAALALITPIGAILQSPQIVLSMLNIVNSSNDPPLDGINPQIEPRAGFALGCISFALIAASLIMPIGTGIYGSDKRSSMSLRSRLLVFSFHH